MKSKLHYFRFKNNISFFKNTIDNNKKNKEKSIDLFNLVYYDQLAVPLFCCCC
eukprot:UN08201